MVVVVSRIEVGAFASLFQPKRSDDTAPDLSGKKKGANNALMRIYGTIVRWSGGGGIIWVDRNFSKVQRFVQHVLHLPSKKALKTGRMTVYSIKNNQMP